MTREAKILQLKDSIEKIGKEYNGLLNDQIDIPKLNLNQFPLIKTILHNLKLKTFLFKEIFTGSDMETFDPTALELRPDKKASIVEEPAFIVKNKYHREFLVYCGARLVPQYLWELVSVVVEEPTPEEPGEGDGSEEDAGDEELSFE